MSVRSSLLLGLAACAPELAAPPVDGVAEASRVRSDTELVFSAGFGEEATGLLLAGTDVRLVYDPVRLPTCRGTRNGREAWAIHAFWRLDGGPVQRTLVAAPGARQPAEVWLPLDVSGELELWFRNADAEGCTSWDSDFGANYRFLVVDEAVQPDWMGAASTVISRATCNGTFCDQELRPADQGFVYDTWARQRAAVAFATFQVYEPGVTDVANAWVDQQLDARVRFSTDPTLAASDWDFADLHSFVGNDARFSYPLRELDPLGGNTITDPADCPAAELRPTPDGQYVEADLWYWFEVNGAELRPAAGGAWHGTFVDYVGLYTLCL